MLGLMQDQPLLISSLIEFAERHHGDAEIVSRRVEGDIQQLDASFPVTELWRVLAGRAPGRQQAHEVTVFDSVGFALEDYSALRYVHQLATARHLEAAALARSIRPVDDAATTTPRLPVSPPEPSPTATEPSPAATGPMPVMAGLMRTRRTKRSSKKTMIAARMARGQRSSW